MKKYKLVWNAFEQIEFGEIELDFLDQGKTLFKGKKPGPKAHLKINDRYAIESIISGGDVAFGEGYIDGLWESNNLCDLIYVIALNSQKLEQFFHANKLKALWLFLRTLFNKNTKFGSRKNISFHYDLGNDFYELWLDKSMTYSSAFFDKKNISLFAAQQKKYQNILDKLSGKTILEIGCGWGGFAQNALEGGFDVTGLTLSKEQKKYADARLKKFKKSFKAKLQDYRDEKEAYDNIVSIEMFEAVGKEYWDGYFQTLKRCLHDKGRALLQIITIDENVFEDYQNRVDFIQKYIFPGGILPSKVIIHKLAEQHGFYVKSEIAFGHDYAKTLQIWLENFDNKKEQVKDLGFDEEFIRKWRFYLAYCYGGFMARRTDVVQFELIKK